MQEEPAGGATASVAYEGRVWPLLWLATKTLLLTVLTLGIYRFWMKTRLRRYYWSAIRVDGEPLEYTGRAVELLLGFLLAVVFLAVYLGFFNLLLTFVGISYFQGHPLALNLSLVGLLPVLFYAQYRARRYLLSRTRWRGIRFAAEKGAVSYAWRGCLYLLASVATLGLLVPWMQFRLAKFSLDRTWFGDRQFLQRGRWTDLLYYWIWAFLPVLAAGIYLAATAGPSSNWFEEPVSEEQSLEIAGLMALIVVLWVATAIWYNARSFRYLNSNRTLGRSISFRSDLKARKVFGVYLVAMIGFGVGALVISLIVGVLGAVGAVLIGGAEAGFERFFDDVVEGEAAGYAALGLVVEIYLMIFALFSALNHVLLTQPLLRTYAESLEIRGAHALDRVRQRDGVDLAEAEGFADALDVGAAF